MHAQVVETVAIISDSTQCLKYLNPLINLSLCVIYADASVAALNFNHKDGEHYETITDPAFSQ